MEWSGEGLRPPVRRYVPLEIERPPDGVCVHAELQYVWRDSGEVGDSSRVTIELGIRDGLISSWYLIDEPRRSVLRSFGPVLGLTCRLEPVREPLQTLTQQIGLGVDFRRRPSGFVG